MSPIEWGVGLPQLVGHFGSIPIFIDHLLDQGTVILYGSHALEQKRAETTGFLSDSLRQHLAARNTGQQSTGYRPLGAIINIGVGRG